MIVALPSATSRRVVHVAALLATFVVLLGARDDATSSTPIRPPGTEGSWPMFGGSPARNMVNTEERKLPADWCVAEGKRKNIRWMANLGDRTIGSPVVADGKVFITTKQRQAPRDPTVEGDKGVLMAFRESDGQFLWQIAHDVPENLRRFRHALPSTPTAIGGWLYYTTGAGEVVCADADQGKIRWRFDMIKELKVHPYREWCPGRVAPPLSSPLVVGNLVFAATGNGVDAEGDLVSPGAPSFVALDKRTGKLAWQSNLPGANIVEGTWSSPAYSDHDGRSQVIFAGGDGVIYGFVPETGALLWKCDCLLDRKPRGDTEIDNQFVGTPVVVGDKLYIGMGLAGGGPRNPRSSYFLCLDITRKGDVSLKSYDAKADSNKGSALIWAFGGPLQPRPERGPRIQLGPTISTAAVHQGLVYVTEQNGYLHCLDAASGSRLWVYDLQDNLCGSPYLADNRVFVATESGDILIFGHQRAARVQAPIEMEELICTTPVAANGTLYLATDSKLFAIASPLIRAGEPSGVSRRVLPLESHQVNPGENPAAYAAGLAEFASDAGCSGRDATGSANFSAPVGFPQDTSRSREAE